MGNQSPTIIALGNFDGIHRGHRQVIDSILTQFKESIQSSARVVVSFEPHPQEFFTGIHRPLLTPLSEKQDYLRLLGVDELRLLPFDAAMARLTPREFVESVLIKDLNVRSISVGQNFRFGHRRAGNTEDLKAIAAEHDIPVYIAPLYRCGSERVSSSAIRNALDKGDVSAAKRLLGRPYRLIGSVVKGQQLGRTLGFPTANLHLPDDKLRPKYGVYAVNVFIHANNGFTMPQASDLKPLPGVMNIGNRPTVDGFQQTTEVHLLDWQGDLYGKTVTVELLSFLRPEQRFDSLDALKTQISHDCEQARLLKL
ncbi:MAG: bifunctional riboflavin kinase/FAD synthetase [Cyanobacteria bacterium P01_F01_bin.150]